MVTATRTAVKSDSRMLQVELELTRTCLVLAEADLAEAIEQGNHYGTRLGRKAIVQLSSQIRSLEYALALRSRGL